MKQLAGRVAVITGGASGIGRATASLLAERGCRLALADVNAEGLEAVAKGLREGGAAVSTHLVDVADAAQMEALPAAVVAEHGAAHIVVNNAGVTVAANFEDQSLEDLQWIIGINLWGVIHGCKFFLPLLKEQDEAHIVNLSSLFGFLGVPSQSSYCATKFAVRGLSEALWVELKDTNVGVTSIHPGGVNTNITTTMRGDDQELREASADALARSRGPEAVARKIVRAIERDRLRAIVGIEAYVGEWLKRLMPVRTQRLLANRMKNFAQRAD
ncbi:MAG: SDR family NAD(P)-dependent oxidoreductase [Myxococcota bacterium]